MRSLAYSRATVDPPMRRYAHAQTTVFLESGTGRRYADRGWCTYESTVARILKQRSAMVWDAVIDVGDPADGGGDATRGRQMQAPPPSPASFNETLRSLRFTNGADSDTVARLYERTLRSALGGSVHLLYEDAGWRDEHHVLVWLREVFGGAAMAKHRGGQHIGGPPSRSDRGYTPS